MTEVERILNDAMALPNINDGNLLRHNGDLRRHQIVILLEVVNDAVPCCTSRASRGKYGPCLVKDLLNVC